MISYILYMNDLPYDIVKYIYDFTDIDLYYKKIYDKIMFDYVKRPWMDFREYFIEQFKEHKTGKLVVSFYIFDENPDFENKRTIVSNPIWRPAYVNITLLGNSWNDGFPAHSSVRVLKYKNYDDYELIYPWNSYWKPI